MQDYHQIEIKNITNIEIKIAMIVIIIRFQNPKLLSYKKLSIFEIFYLRKFSFLV